MTRPWSEGFELLKKPQTLAELLLAATLLWLGFAVPLAFALGIHWLISWQIRRSVGDELRVGDAIWGRPALYSLVLITCLHFALLTEGSREILGPETLSGSFDSLAQGFLRGTSEVDPATIRWEAIVVEGRTYFYFGPWPALLRIPLQWLAPERFGQWARLSCVVASAISLAAFALLSIRMLARNLSLGEQEKHYVLITSVLGFGLGSLLFFMMKDGSIYHESILWGLAGSMCFLSILIPRLDAPEALRKRLTLLSAIAGAAFLSRVTFGAPLYLILLLIAGNELVRQHRAGERAIGVEAGRLVMAMLPAGLFLVFQLWYNFDRFGSIFDFADIRLLEYVGASPPTLEILDRTGVLNIRRIPSALENYFVPDMAMIFDQFPWFRITPPEYPDRGLYPRIFAAHVFPLTLMSSWIVLGSAIGSVYLFRNPGSGFGRLCFLALLVEALLICSFYIIELRYAVDIMPLFVFGYAMFLAEMSTRGPLRGRAQDLAMILIFAVLSSVIVTISSTLSGAPQDSPTRWWSHKADSQERFSAVDSFRSE